MSNKLTYKQAVNLLAAYLGCNIKVDKPTSLNYFRCTVARMTKTGAMQYDYIQIAEAKDWESLLDKIIPLELKQDGKPINYTEIGSASRLYQYRHIGKCIKADS